MTITRRNMLAGAGAVAATTLLSRAAGAQSFPFTMNQRYPDPAVQILDPSFAKYRIYSSTIEQVATGMRWAEGPAYFPEGGYLLFLRHPNNRIMKFDEKTGQTTVFAAPSNYANGNTRDRQGRLVSCEHSVTRRITRTGKDGKITVLADKFEGKRLNAPNDIVVKSDDSIWFTDPLFGINGEWEGKKEKPESRPPPTSTASPRTQDHGCDHRHRQSQRAGVLAGREEALRHRVEGLAQPQHLELRRNADGTLGSRSKLIDAADQARSTASGSTATAIVGAVGQQRRVAVRAHGSRRPQGVPAQGQVRGPRRRDGVQSRG